MTASTQSPKQSTLDLNCTGGKGIMNRIADGLSDLGKIERPAAMDGRRMIMVIMRKPGGPAGKSSGAGGGKTKRPAASAKKSSSPALSPSSATPASPAEAAPASQPKTKVESAGAEASEEPETGVAEEKQEVPSSTKDSP